MQADFQAQGATLLAISPDLPDYLRPFKKEKGLGFDLLHDPGGNTANDYGLSHALPTELQTIYARFGIDLPTFNGDGVWRLPLPAHPRCSRVSGGQTQPDALESRFHRLVDPGWG